MSDEYKQFIDEEVRELNEQPLEEVPLGFGATQ